LTSQVIHDRAQPRPTFSEKQAASIATELFDLSGSIRELTSERDQNFLLTAQHDQFVLKIAAQGEQRETLEFQNAVMNHLQNRVTTGFVPRALKNKTGREIAAVTDQNNVSHFVRLVTYLPAQLLSEVRYHSPGLLRGLGKLLGEIDRGLDGFSHPAMSRELKWDLQGALWIKDCTHHIADPGRRAIVERIVQRFEERVIVRTGELRKSVVHNDANDYNVLVARDDDDNLSCAGLIDFGDMLYTYTASEVAVAVAYAMLDKPDPLATAANVLAGYHEAFPLSETELELLLDLISMRLAVSVTNSALQQKLHPENEYLLVTERPAWALLEQLQNIDPSFAESLFRAACGLEPFKRQSRIVDLLQSNRSLLGKVVDVDFENDEVVVFDLSVGSLEFSDLAELADNDLFSSKVFHRLKEAGAQVGIGRYNEPRLLYTSDVFATSEGENRTIHIGIDLFMPAGTPVFAPMDGVIHSFANNNAALDYGPTIIAEHFNKGDGTKFFTLYGHLSEDSLEGLHRGKEIRRGDQLARIGAPPVNGGWPPHLHFQIIGDMLGKSGDFPGVAPASQRGIWLSICPDPNLILGIPESKLTKPWLESDELLRRRSDSIGRSLSLSYRKPLHIVKGWKQHLYDSEGRRYLDCVNNVAHVGHCHSKVVEAASLQMRALNTNTRYLHENIELLAERLTATMPDPLKVCFFVNSGSEANELALRLAHAKTGGTDVICVDGAYHGNTNALIEISPYKFDGPGGRGAPSHVRKVTMPDTYRGPYRSDDLDAGRKYAQHVKQAIDEIDETGKRLSTFICESALGCGGQIILPARYLEHSYSHVRRARGVCIADEVQTGLGRAGSHFWAFQTQNVVPDIVTIGKPLGNGHPLAAVVTTREIAESFNNGMEYFNSFGGNPVSCAVGLAVLQVIEAEGLQEHAMQAGFHLQRGLDQLKSKHPVVGDVRGLGLFSGIELVLDRKTQPPADRRAAYAVERMKEKYILLSTDGPLHNVIKIKPPLAITISDIDDLLEKLDDVLAE